MIFCLLEDFFIFFCVVWFEVVFIDCIVIWDVCFFRCFVDVVGGCYDVVFEVFEKYNCGYLVVFEGEVKLNVLGRIGLFKEES